jgi:hypothetical protein
MKMSSKRSLIGVVRRGTEELISPLSFPFFKKTLMKVATVSTGDALKTR